VWFSLAGLLGFSGAGFAGENASAILSPDSFSHHLKRFNSMEDENVTNHISNAESFDWLQGNIPFFECPDAEVEELYYFRWWSFRKHLKKTPKGFVFTEFLTPVSHAGEFNTVSCATGHHIAEGRWLRGNRWLDDYIQFWLRGYGGQPEPHFHKFSSWFAAAVYERYLVNQDLELLLDLLPDLVADYRSWEEERQLPGGLFWQFDVRDGMEESISGSRSQPQARPTINSYMFGNARAIHDIALLANRPELADEFAGKAETLRVLVSEYLWDPASQFYEVRPPQSEFAGVREEIGFLPWRFHLPKPGEGHEIAWAQLMDVGGFRAPAGITTAERRHPGFRSHGVGTCEWDGAIWPFASAQTLDALANVVRDYPQDVVGAEDYFDAFLAYAQSQHAGDRPFIGEYLDEVTGDWINGRDGRSRYYNHSTFADLLITGVVGLRPRADEVVEVEPLLPPGAWDWFCLDRIKYHGRALTILWDQDGTRYGCGAGLQVLADGKPIARGDRLTKISGKLPQ
jgi:hypothetical protein